MIKKIQNWFLKRWFKTYGFKHQLHALKISAMREYFALLMEQGTGKSWVVVLTAAFLRRAGKIDALLIIAPKGVAPGWLRQQLPEHMPDDVEYVAARWRAGMPKYMQRALREVTEERDKLRVVVMNTEAFGMTATAIDFALGFIEDAGGRVLVVVDESHRIKTPTASTTKRILNLGTRADYRRILTGTVADKPFDVYSQYCFLSPQILETDSFTAFRNEYARMEPADSGIMRHIAMRIPKVWKGRYIDDITGKPAEGRVNIDGSLRNKYMEPKYLPPIVARNPDGSPAYRNLEKLHALTAPHSYRVLKRDCLDLPEKLYNRYYTELDGGMQTDLYNQIKEESRVEWEDGRISTFNKLTVYLRLQQVICGYIPNEDNVLQEIFPSWRENPRIVSTLELLDDRPPGEGTIIWCRFIHDIKRLQQALAEAYGKRAVVEFHGSVKDKQRQENVERFEGERIVMSKSGKVVSRSPVPDKDRPRFMLAQPQSGGVGQTWVAANLSLHYSNMFSLIDRLQCEDRPHRIGQKRTVNYIDIEAEDTVDSIIIGSLVAKKEVANIINGDKGVAWLG